MLDSGKQELWSRVLRGSTLKEIRFPSRRASPATW